MFIHSKLSLLIVVLILHDHVHAGRIIGGHEAVAHSRPYMVFLERNMGGGDIRYCGGFLLSEDFVMTAAHCQAKTYTVYLGLHRTNNMNNDVQCIPVKHAFPHQDYKKSTYKNDAMLLKLSFKAKLSNTVAPIDLAVLENGSLPTSCIVCGWGQENPMIGMLSPKLMETNITLVANEDCAKHNFYCSLGDVRPGQGDSGGPLVCEDVKAYGVVSSMFKSNAKNLTLFRYTKISDYKDWIISTIKEAVTEN